MDGFSSASQAVLCALLAPPTSSTPVASSAAVVVLVVRRLSIRPSLYPSVGILHQSLLLAGLVSLSHRHYWRGSCNILSAGLYSARTVRPCVSDLAGFSGQVTMANLQRDAAHCELANVTAEFNKIKFENGVLHSAFVFFGVHSKTSVWPCYHSSRFLTLLLRSYRHHLIIWTVAHLSCMLRLRFSVSSLIVCLFLCSLFFVAGFVKRFSLGRLFFQLVVSVDFRASQYCLLFDGIFLLHYPSYPDTTRHLFVRNRTRLAFPIATIAMAWNIFFSFQDVVFGEVPELSYAVHYVSIFNVMFDNFTHNLFVLAQSCFLGLVFYN